MNDLEAYFRNNTGRLIHKWHHYFEIYDRHFQRYRNTDAVIVEIGVSQGGSLQMWKNYFGPKARIYGVDLNPNCKNLEEQNISIFIGSQSDRKFLRALASEIPPVDILIDDGGHKMDEQIITFEELFSKVKSGGVYLCEDMQTSYRLRYGGGVRRRGTFVEYSKNFIDAINAYHSEQTSLSVNSFTRSARSLHFYDGVLVIEKKEVPPPVHSKSGTQSFENDPTPNVRGAGLLKDRLLLALNLVLRFFRLPSVRWGRSRT